MSGEEKARLRKLMLEKRRLLDPGEVQQGSAAVMDNLKSSGLLENCGLFALYASAGGEVNTRPLFEELVERGKIVVLPRVRGRGPEIDFFQASDWDALETSSFGIPEPVPSAEPVPPGEFDFVLVPGVAFDRRGARLGFGMGCYDRVLEKIRPGTPAVGVAYDFQVVDEVPAEPHDVFLTAVVSESGIALSPPGEKRLNIEEKGEAK